MPPTYACVTHRVSLGPWHSCVHIALSPITQKRKKKNEGWKLKLVLVFLAQHPSF